MTNSNETCEICGTSLRKIYGNMSRKEGTIFLECPKCGLRWAPYLDVDRTFHSRLDEKSRKKALSSIRNHEFEQVNRLVKNYVKKGARGIEVGCAYGWYMDSIGEDYQIEGIEPEDSIAEQARSRGHVVHTGFFPQDVPTGTEKYDFMVFNNVWEHINHISNLIEGSIQLLKDGGVMIITIPLSSGGVYRISELFEKIGRTKELVRLWQLHFHSPHIYYFNKHNFKQIMERFNCCLVSCEDVHGSIDPKRMKERFEMDSDEKHGSLKAALFRIAFPILKCLPADKAVFVFRYKEK